MFYRVTSLEQLSVAEFSGEYVLAKRSMKTALKCSRYLV